MYSGVPIAACNLVLGATFDVERELFICIGLIRNLIGDALAGAIHDVSYKNGI